MGKRRLPPNVRQHRDGGYRAVIGVQGTRVHGPLRPTIEEAAKDVAALRVEFARDRGRGVTLRELRAMLFEDIEARGLTTATRSYYENHWRILVKHGFGEDVLVEEITPAHVERYAAKRRAQGVADSTIWKKELQALDRACRILIRAGKLKTNPVVLARRPRIRTSRFGVLSRERIVQCIEKLRAFDPLPNVPRPEAVRRAMKRRAAIVSLLFLTGIRRSELTRIRTRDVDFESARLFIHGKTGNRQIPLGSEALDAIRVLAGDRALRDPDARVSKGVRSLEKAFAAIHAATGEPNLTCHVLRHSFATEMVKQGVQPFVLAALMGHSDTRQTSRYFHIEGVDARSAMAGMTIRAAERPAPDERGAES